MNPPTRKSFPSAPPPSHSNSNSHSLSLEDYSPPSNLDQWVTLSCIGQGSFGVIHKVQRKGDGVIAAMKQIDYSKMPPKDRKQILAEVNILDTLKSRHVVQLIDKILDKKEMKIYIIMEYCGGGDLSRVLHTYRSTHRLLPESLIWSYFIQLVLGLNHCHYPDEREREREAQASLRGDGSGGMGKKLNDLGIVAGGGAMGGIGRMGYRSAGAVLGGGGEGKRMSAGGGAGQGQVLHRDLKPENIFLDEQDQVKLGDFGLSKNMTADMTTTYVGTPLYMPPEILREREYNMKSDIWSLGCLIYELCMTHSPFSSAKTQQELIMRVNQRKYEPISTGYSAALRELVGKMMQLKPENRPSTKELLSHPDMQYWRSEYEKKKVKTDHDRLAQEMEKKLDQILALKHSVNERELALVQRESASLKREQHLEEQYRLARDEYNAFRSERATHLAFHQEELEKIGVQRRALAGETNVLQASQMTFIQEKRAFEEQRAVWEQEVRAEKARMVSSGSEGSAGSMDDKRSNNAQRKFSQLPRRPTMEDRAATITAANAADMLRARSHLSSFPDMDTPSKIPAYVHGLGKRNNIGDVANNGTPLRSRLQTKSMNNLRAQAKLNLENSPPSPAPSDDSVVPMDLGTPVPQRSFTSRASFSSPSELDRISAAHAAKSAMMIGENGQVEAAPMLSRMRGVSYGPESVAPPVDVKTSRPSLPHSSTAIGLVGAVNRTPAKSMIPVPSDYNYDENATPAKWQPDDDNAPSPFMKTLKKGFASLTIDPSRANDAQAPRSTVLGMGAPSFALRGKPTRENLRAMAARNAHANAAAADIAGSAAAVDKML